MTAKTVVAEVIINSLVASQNVTGTTFVYFMM